MILVMYLDYIHLKVGNKRARLAGVISNCFFCLSVTCQADQTLCNGAQRLGWTHVNAPFEVQTRGGRVPFPKNEREG